MSKGNNQDHISDESTQSTASKIGTAIKSAAEYALVEGVGKTAKNFAGGVSSGAKQGYGYFTTDKNHEMRDNLIELEGLVNEQLKEANKSLGPTAAQYIDLSQDESYKKLGFKERLDLLSKYIQQTKPVTDSIDKNKQGEEHAAPDTQLAKLEEIVQNQFNLLNETLSASDHYPDLSKDQEYAALNFKEKIDHLIQLSKSAFIEMGNEVSDWKSQLVEAYNLSKSLKKAYDEKAPHSTDEIIKNPDLERKERESKAQVLIKSLEEMYEKSPEGSKIEQYKLTLNGQLHLLADKVSIIDEQKDKTAQNYEEKISLIKDKLHLLHKALTSEHPSTEPNSVTNSGDTANTTQLLIMAF